MTTPKMVSATSSAVAERASDAFCATAAWIGAQSRSPPRAVGLAIIPHAPHTLDGHAHVDVLEELFGHFRMLKRRKRKPPGFPEGFQVGRE
jgi:hypothetical protein